jgi:hypothetical protein
VVPQGREEAVGFRGEKGKVSVLDDSPAEPAPSAVAGFDQLVGNHVEHGNLAYWQQDEV